MELTNNIILNRVFTKNTLMDLINKKDNIAYCTAVKRYLKDIESKDNDTLISEVYKVMKKTYRNEYFYKNTLLNKLLIGKHSFNTTTALTEIPINKSKADFVLINGKAVVYEIKTELDTFERLEAQISDYYKAFNNVCVVTCESNFNKIRSLLDNTKIGIYILTKNNTISPRKEPNEDNSFLDYSVLFKILRKGEFENILLKHYGQLPITSQVNYYDECYNLFKEINLELAYRYFLEELKNRNIIEVKEYIEYVPYELKFLIYFSKFKKSDYSKLDAFLRKGFGD